MANPGFPKMRLESVVNHTRGRFKDRVAIVTGGASGIGRATTERILLDGGTVAIFDINEPLGGAVESDLRAKGHQVTHYNIDVSRKDAVVAGVTDVVEKYGGVHYLVNSAVYFGSAGLTADHEDWVKSYGVNVEGTANMAQACYEHMKKGDGSAIVNLSSTAAVQVLPKRWNYTASKAAVCQLTKCMALDMREKQVRVNAVLPGAVYTPEIEKALYSRENADAYYGDGVQITGRAADPEEIASFICFLLSEEASSMTGGCYLVDGGRTALSGEGFGNPDNIAATKQ